MNNFDFLTSLDTSKAAKELDIDTSPLWDAFTARQTFTGSPHKQTKCIPLRGALSFSDSYRINARRKATGYARMLPHTTALVNAALRGLNVRTVGNVLAVALAPGGFITPHEDLGDYPAHFERFHIAVTSPKDNWFRCGDEYAFPKPGDVFFFNHRITHSVGNPSEDWRINLIVDVTLKD